MQIPVGSIASLHEADTYSRPSRSLVGRVGSGVMAFLLILGSTSLLFAAQRFLGSESPSAETRRLIRLSELSNRLSAVESAGSYLVASIGHTVAIIEPKAVTPTIIGRSAPLWQRVIDLQVEGTTAIATLNGGYVATVDISDPERPIVARTLHSGLEGPLSVSVVTDQLHILFSTFLRIVDISNIYSPTIVAKYDRLRDRCAHISSHRSRIYLTCSNRSNSEHTMVIVDVSAGQSITTTATLTLPERAGAITARGSFLFVIAQTSMRVITIDVSVPTAPRIVSSTEPLGVSLPMRKVSSNYPKFITVDGSTLMISDPDYGLALIDIDRPDQTEVLIGFDLATTASDAAIIGDEVYACLCSTSLEYPPSPLKLLKIADRRQLKLVRQLVAPYDGQFWTVSKAGNNLFALSVSAGVTSLVSVDVSSPERPNIVARLALPERGWWGIVPLSGYLLVSSDAEVTVMSRSPDGNLEFLGRSGMPQGFHPTAELGNYVVGVGDDGLSLVSAKFTNPLSPTIVGTLTSDRAIGSLTISGSLISFADDYWSDGGSGRLSTARLDESGLFSLVNQFDLGVKIVSVTSYGSLVLVSSSDQSLYGVDISDPRRPRIAYSDRYSGGFSIRSDGEYLYSYVSGADSGFLGVFVLSASGPPVWLASYTSIHHDVPMSLFAEVGTMFYTTEYGELIIDRILNDSGPTPAATPSRTIEAKSTSTPTGHAPQGRVLLPVSWR